MMLTIRLGYLGSLGVEFYSLFDAAADLVGFTVDHRVDP